MTTRRKLLLGSVSSLIAIWFILGYVGAYFMVMPKNRDFEDIAELGGQPVTPLTLTTRDGVAVSAWHVEGPGEKAVIFAHGISSNRKQGNRVAEQYAKRGYDVLMVDARGHGKSQPATCTIGWDERFDLLAAYDWLRDRGFETIGAHGISMGAATIVYSVQEEVDYDFVVLESCYDTIENALRNRLAMFSVPTPVVFPFRLATQWQMGVGPDQLRPVDFMDRLTMPVLILAGDSEPELKVGETQALFDACGSVEKEMYLFQGGTHEVFLRRFEAEYLRYFERFMETVETRTGARLAAA